MSERAGGSLSTRLRWVLVGLVLVVAAAVAFWPRSQPQPAAAPAPDLTALRAKAALAKCPAPQGGGGAAAKLSGLKVECMADGSAVDLGAVLGGRPALVNFWEPWCLPCRDELKALQDYAAEPGAATVLLVQVPANSDQASGLDMLAGLGVHLPSVWDPSGAVAKVLGKPNAFPISYVVDAGGAAHRVLSPAVFTTPDQVRQAVRQQGNGVATG
ncbi:TlpA disulfide reductase family protein [Kutzneria viridogrisea]|uniref:Thioredoxin domain-containing protein n=2 Tax=Kutzneria TaxID=43356 RepID=W5W691_9PSEU|nr:TlpA disulfide reductase family protein [Kutzneria albida]AHH93684.1 hypothetical protein KALB_307 [Kutzneria albida DSM 43870]MBA8931312.1 thiol-disulfide isomerase/thioredoxin [Kutzneria viridogrisea]